jgi:ubiquinone/menaquinone biosynthesis C-methylase UbiE
MSVELRVARQQAGAAALATRVSEWLEPTRGDERALDAGCGAGALAVALAPLVGEVVGVDRDDALLAEARRLAPANATFVAADARALPFESASVDLAGTLRVLHHVDRPERVLGELARVTRPGGRLLVVDQLGHLDPLVSLELDRFERARDPSHARLLPDGDIRSLLEANGLVVVRNEVAREQRDLEAYLDLADCVGEARERARALAPGESYEVEVGWYLAVKPST